VRVLIIGCGYVGLPLGVELLRQGHAVSGLRRSAAGAASLQSAGLHPLTADITRPGDLAKLPLPYDWIVNTISDKAVSDKAVSDKAVSDKAVSERMKIRKR